MTDFTHYHQSRREGYCIGYVSLTFRQDNTPIRDVNCGNPFILNNHDDTWFRRTEGISKGYGLCIKNVKVTANAPKTMGDFNCYKVKVDYIGWNSENLLSEFMWLTIHEDFSLNSVLEYIDKHKENWIP